MAKQEFAALTEVSMALGVRYGALWASVAAGEIPAKRVGGRLFADVAAARKVFADRGVLGAK